MLTDSIVPSNKGSGKATKISGKRRYLLPFLDEGQCMDTVILYCYFFSFLLLLSYETKYDSSHIEARIMNTLFKVKLHKDSDQIS